MINQTMKNEEQSQETTTRNNTDQPPANNHQNIAIRKPKQNAQTITFTTEKKTKIKSKHHKTTKTLLQILSPLLVTKNTYNILQSTSDIIHSSTPNINKYLRTNNVSYSTKPTTSTGKNIFIKIT